MFKPRERNEASRLSKKHCVVLVSAFVFVCIVVLACFLANQRKQEALQKEQVPAQIEAAPPEEPPVEEQKPVSPAEPAVEEAAPMDPVTASILQLQSGDFLEISGWSGDEKPELEHLHQLITQAVETPAAKPEQIVLWWFDVLLSENSLIRLEAGLAENLVCIQLGSFDQRITVENAELYWLVRRCYDRKPLGIDQEGYALCRDLLEAHLQELPPLPDGMQPEQVKKELTGFVLADSSEKLNAHVYQLVEHWTVDPPEDALKLYSPCELDSSLRVLLSNSPEAYIVVVDDVPIGFVGWWFLMNRTLDEMFETQEALIEAVKNDG